MKYSFLGAVSALVMATTACQPTLQRQAAAGATFGGAVGFVGAQIFDANPAWTAVAVLAGATAGTLIATNPSSQQCAYADGFGGYYLAPC